MWKIIKVNEKVFWWTKTNIFLKNQFSPTDSPLPILGVRKQLHDFIIMKLKTTKGAWLTTNL